MDSGPVVGEWVLGLECPRFILSWKLLNFFSWGKGHVPHTPGTDLSDIQFSTIEFIYHGGPEKKGTTLYNCIEAQFNVLSKRRLAIS